MEDEDKMLPDWLANMIRLKIPEEMQNKFKEDMLLKYENEIDRLTKKCNELRKYEGELLEKIEQLEKQIEIMMNCENCNGHSSLTCGGCNNYSKWGIKNDNT